MSNTEVQGHFYKRKQTGGKEIHLKPNDPTPATIWVQYDVNGKRRFRSMKTSDYQTAVQRWADMKASLMTITDEEAYLQRLIQDGENARLKLAQVAHGGGIVPIKEAFDRYLKSHRRRTGTKESTIDGYQQQFNDFIAWSPGVRNIRDLTSSVCERYIDHLESGGKVNADTVDKHIKALRMIWKTIDPTWPNPWEGLHSKLEHVATHYRRLTMPECRTIHEKAQGEYKTLVLLAYSTGQRRGDCANLTWDMINMKSKIITFIPAKTSKRGSPMVKMPMTKQLHDCLSDIKKRDGYVMPEIARLYVTDRSAISKTIKGIMDDGDIKDTDQGTASFHAFRKTFTSMLADAGADLSITSYLTSHALPGVMSTYSEPNVEVLRTWINKSIPKL